MNTVVELPVDHRDDGCIRYAIHEHALSVLNGVPAFGVGAVDKPADLHVVEGKLGLAEVGANRGDEVAEHSGIRFRAAPHGIALALIPENAFDFAAGEIDLPQHRTVKTGTPLLFFGRAPLRHAGPAVGGGDKSPTGTPVDSTIATAKGSPRPAPFLRVL